MAKALFARIAGGLAITLLAAIFVSLLPLLSAARSASYVSSPPATVNRQLKGDLLPFHTALGPAILKSDFDSLSARAQPQADSQPKMTREIPFACDPSFSSVATPRLAYIYGRCMS